MKSVAEITARHLADARGAYKHMGVSDVEALALLVELQQNMEKERLSLLNTNAWQAQEIARLRDRAG